MCEAGHLLGVLWTRVGRVVSRVCYHRATTADTSRSIASASTDLGQAKLMRMKPEPSGPNASPMSIQSPASCSTSDVSPSSESPNARGAGAMLSFEIAEGHDSLAFFKALRLVSFATSLGGTDTLACHPNTDSNSEVPDGPRAAMGITDDLVRISVGIENGLDVWKDLERALAASRR